MADWQQSSHCAQGESCVHVAATDDTVKVMESSDPAHTTLTTTRPAFAALARTLKARLPA